LGTVAVIDLPEGSTTTAVAFTQPNVILFAPTNPVPVMVTLLPTAPPAGAKPAITGTTLNDRLLVSVPPGVITFTLPVVPLAGMRR
jgi:hypothetical protein